MRIMCCRMNVVKNCNIWSESGLRNRCELISVWHQRPIWPKFHFLLSQFGTHFVKSKPRAAFHSEIPNHEEVLDHINVPHNGKTIHYFYSPQAKHEVSSKLQFQRKLRKILRKISVGCSRFRMSRNAFRSSRNVLDQRPSNLWNAGT